ncbi:unnamed protein product [Pseudo-nitzschia multistriata]|uniref:DNA-(apurinic or apyrimidinic site) lyase n=1 Tax=Pseudo-nitzschia multistriata TaxID=183589 RepID=A0A448ZJV9_9STRA|nr:unnamed protein product [Pseudo-nitzschia multistriata]
MAQNQGSEATTDAPFPLSRSLPDRFARGWLRPAFLATSPSPSRSPSRSPSTSLFVVLAFLLLLLLLPVPPVRGLCTAPLRVGAMRAAGRPTAALRRSPRAAKRGLSASPGKTDPPRVRPVPITPSPKRPRRRGTAFSETTIPAPGPVENHELELTTRMLASIRPEQGFVDLGVPPVELRPSNTLTNGQCFHWRVVHPEKAGPAAPTASASAWGTHDAKEWVGVLRLPLFGAHESAVVVVRELPETTLYRPLVVTRGGDLGRGTEPGLEGELHRALAEYFQLGVPLEGLYEEWSEACPRLSVIAGCLPGVRILQQDPWECLASFICSSNNNIPRITKILASIRREYGRPLLRIPSESGSEYCWLYSFPSLEELSARATEKDLRETCGMGYRAGYILETMKLLGDDARGGEAYLHQTLRHDTTDPGEVQDLLCEFRGVGRKVADCVALFSLNQDDAVPVDTHVWNIAIRDYDPEGVLRTTVRSLTASNYKKVGEVFRGRFPNRAGWAHSLLFVAELPSFRGLLPDDLANEMETFQKEEKARKKEEREQTKTKAKLKTKQKPA